MCGRDLLRVKMISRLNADKSPKGVIIATEGSLIAVFAVAHEATLGLPNGDCTHLHVGTV